MDMTNASNNDNRDMNRDPLSGAPGAHPIGTGVGATGGAIAGAAIGAVGGPVGSLVGGAIGAVVGGLGGKAAGEAVNPTAEDAHWRSTYENEPYRNQAYGYDDYAPAYKLGYSARDKYQGQTFDSAENSLAGEWEQTKGQSRMAWQDAKPAVRAAWHRVERKLPGDADGDGV
jgi:phage tail tape-measure protein